MTKEDMAILYQNMKRRNSFIFERMNINFYEFNIKTQGIYYFKDDVWLFVSIGKCKSAFQLEFDLPDSISLNQFSSIILSKFFEICEACL